MALTDTTTKIVFTTGTTSFVFPFKVYATSDLLVYLYNTTTKVYTPLALTTNYTVALTTDAPSAGTVTLLVARPAGSNVIIQRNTALTQEIDFVDDQAVPATTQNKALDKLTMIVQELLEKINRCGAVGVEYDTFTAGIVDNFFLLSSGIPFAGQIAFPASQNPSADANTLDDYEEGTWTPGYSTSGGSFAYSSQTGKYTKIGRHVFCCYELQTSSATVGTGVVSMTGLPFVVSNSFVNSGGGSGVGVSGAFAVNHPTNLITDKGAATCTIYTRTIIGGSNLALQATDLAAGAGGNLMAGSFDYDI